MTKLSVRDAQAYEEMCDEGELSAPKNQLLLFNAVSHGQVETLPLLNNVSVRFLTKGITFILQPLKVRILCVLQKADQQHVSRHAFKFIDEGVAVKCAKLTSKRILPASMRLGM